MMFLALMFAHSSSRCENIDNPQNQNQSENNCKICKRLPIIIVDASWHLDCGMFTPLITVTIAAYCVKHKCTTSLAAGTHAHVRMRVCRSANHIRHLITYQSDNIFRGNLLRANDLQDGWPLQRWRPWSDGESCEQIERWNTRLERYQRHRVGRSH